VSRHSVPRIVSSYCVLVLCPRIVSSYLLYYSVLKHCAHTSCCLHVIAFALLMYHYVHRVCTCHYVPRTCTRICLCRACTCHFVPRTCTRILLSLVVHKCTPCVCTRTSYLVCTIVTSFLVVSALVLKHSYGDIVT
jgi:hypothetical protein